MERGGSEHGTALTRVSPNARLADRLTRRSFTAAELMRLTGMSRKQVTYWAKIGLVRPTMHDPQARPGRPALFYASTEVVKALIACDLRRRGFTPRQVQQVARNLRDFDVQLFESEAYILTDGHSVLYAFSNDQVVDVLMHHHQMLLLVPLHEQLAKLQEVA